MFLWIEACRNINYPLKIYSYSFPNLNNISSTTAFIMTTSGTLSAMKGACKTHKQLILNVFRVYHSSLKCLDVIFFATSLYAITTLCALLVSALYGVKRVYSSKAPTPDNFMDIVDRFNVSIVLFPPMLLNPFKMCKNRRPLKSVRSVITGASIITQEFLDETKQIYPNARIICVYASTEGDIISYIRSDTKSWSSGQTSDGYKIRVRFILF